MFIILRRSKDGEGCETYHKLEAKNAEDALVEAAEYLSDGGAPAAGELDDIFEVAQIISGSMQIISKPMRAEFSVLAATRVTTEAGKKRVKGMLWQILKNGEK